jgi:ParB-like chromosome segregation protein Spo0J
MKIELRKISSIKPYPGNPRLDDAVDAVAASIREFGFRQPIVVDADDVIIFGHTRYKAAIKLGLDKVPVHVAKDLTPAQIKAYRIADNQTASLAEWNYDLLPIELADLQACNFDLGLLGFDGDELAQLLNPDLKEGLCDPDEGFPRKERALANAGTACLTRNGFELATFRRRPAKSSTTTRFASVLMNWGSAILSGRLPWTAGMPRSWRPN